MLPSLTCCCAKRCLQCILLIILFAISHSVPLVGNVCASNFYIPPPSNKARTKFWGQKLHQHSWNLVGMQVPPSMMLSPQYWHCKCSHSLFNNFMHLTNAFLSFMLSSNFQQLWNVEQFLMGVTVLFGTCSQWNHCNCQFSKQSCLAFAHCKSMNISKS